VIESISVFDLPTYLFQVHFLRSKYQVNLNLSNKLDLAILALYLYFHYRTLSVKVQTSGIN